jgi:hypothetical protein
MSHAEALESFAVKTYRYLRWSIVVVVLSMISAVAIERVRAGCFQGSLSAYYYTPVRAVFVGGLVAIGVSLIAIKGSTNREDVLLNLAGVLAPIVAFVPTKPPGSACPSTATLDAAAKLNIDNNVLAFAVGGLAALVLAFGVGRMMRKPTIGKFDPRSLVVLAAGAVILVVGLVWYFGFRDNFLDHAHMGAAVAMFSVVAVVIALNALHRRAHGKSWLWYAGISAAMPISAAVLGAVAAIDTDWHHFVLWLELVELGAFGLYWVLQTFEHWDGGVPTGAEREELPAGQPAVKRAAAVP